MFFLNQKQGSPELNRSSESFFRYLKEKVLVTQCHFPYHPMNKKTWRHGLILDHPVARIPSNKPPLGMVIWGCPACLKTRGAIEIPKPFAEIQNRLLGEALFWDIPTYIYIYNIWEMKILAYYIYIYVYGSIFMSYVENIWWYTVVICGCLLSFPLGMMRLSLKNNQNQGIKPTINGWLLVINGY
jgi:hypothetical protein